MTAWRKTERFIRGHISHRGQECLAWPYGRDGQGYARATARGFSTRLAHRIMCEMVRGPSPFAGAVARHTCGNGHLGCINPNHLVWGTVAENSADMETHGTKPLGERVGCAVLCSDAVKDIRLRQMAGMSQRAIAAAIGVSPGTVQAVIEGRTWGHVA